MPWPIIMLIIIVSVIVYMVIGGVMGAFFVKWYDKNQLNTVAGVRPASSRHSQNWGPFVLGAIFWPIILVARIIHLLGVLVLKGPLKLVKGVGQYTARAILKEGD